MPTLLLLRNSNVTHKIPKQKKVRIMSLVKNRMIVVNIKDTKNCLQISLLSKRSKMTLTATDSGRYTPNTKVADLVAARCPLVEVTISES